MRSRARIVVIGSLVFDFVARAPRLPRRGETILGDLFGMFPGGKGANQAVQAGRLGAEVFIVGCVGQDFLGERLLASLRESGVSSDFVRRDPSVKTAACCIHVDAQGDNSIIIVPEANLACSPQDVDVARDVIRTADIVLVQLEISIPTVQHALAVAAEYGIPTILNPAPAQSVAQSVFGRTTIVTPNEIEAEMLTGTPVKELATPGEGWESETATKLLSWGPQVVILTLGERGAYFATRDERHNVATFRVPVVDTTAAGDAFNGALAVAVAEGKNLTDAVRFANAAGALSTTRAGAQPSLAVRSEVEALLNEPGP
jgi:ribokinase